MTRKLLLPIRILVLFLLYKVRWQPLRDFKARTLRLDRMQRRFYRIERTRRLQCLTNQGRSYKKWTYELAILADRHNSLRFWFSSTLIPTARRYHWDKKHKDYEKV